MALVVVVVVLDLVVETEVGVAPEVLVSVGSGADVVVEVEVEVPEGVSLAFSHAPKVVAKPNNSTVPRTLIFITPLSPIAANTNFSLFNKIPYLLIFLNFFSILDRNDVDILFRLMECIVCYSYFYVPM
ncbi:hypothetical protein [Calothrix sp. PCC 6303]|uniref:hypothetical protein n=1 Tax=Calothrix sp. PCC 6303 TaxID=1170562 RepID=UPI0002A029F1|nr:hypothetical protein [Calothrix sp. PCC 6303]AFZ04220.1 hypothetical protein Cal6303_5337 [Calothrix sp. PCC 6303]